jgi:predicted nucleic acid-binding protein
VAEAQACVVDASVFVDLAVRRQGWAAIAAQLRGRPLHAPAHVDVEVMSAVARLHRGDLLTRAEAGDAIDRFGAAPIQRHDLPPLRSGAWGRLDVLRVTDALYIELAAQLGLRVLSSDERLASASELVTLVE